LKVMSDLRVPFIAIGLFYKQGYFLQTINVRGDQVALYETWNKHHIPMRSMSDEKGKALLIGVNILDRVVYAKVWEVQVGYIKLYLLDTDVPDNIAEDREITNSLYGGTREVRLQQEIILGIGGTKFILEKLKIQPALYHLNEGHSAFLLLERIRSYHHQGMAIDDAIELVRCTSIFTTHTPVPAGNEEFGEDMIKKYFASYAEGMSLPFEDLLALAQSGSTSPSAATSGGSSSGASSVGSSIEVVAQRNFSMTALALRLCAYSNAVSTLHGKVARAMWQGIWPGLLSSEVPITHVTNGVHLATWLGPNMHELYQQYLQHDWIERQDESKVWKEIMLIPNKELWYVHQEQKRKLVDLVKNLILQQYSLRNESKRLINASINCLHEEVLLLGLARRFTSYKRNDLVSKDKERLASILTNNERPIVLLIAGKAHPMDSGGNSLIREIITTLREDRFNGHIIFLEEYNIALAKAMVQGVDVWLNTPILGHEACGTSGMKVGINGGLNFSTRDGWWEEAYNHRLGWEVESVPRIDDLEKRNDIESMFLLNKLEAEVAGLYYAKRKGSFNDDWVNKIKISIALIASKYNTMRMAKEYINAMYCPAILHEEQVAANDYRELREIVTWKKEIVDRFNTVKIKAVLIEGVKENKILAEGLIKVKVLLFSGKLTAHEIKTELILTRFDSKGVESKPIVMPLKLTDSRESGILNFEVEYKVEDTGVYSYGVRVFPYNEKLLNRYEAGVIYWG
jgi:alpha-glucan phosphorylase-like protein